MQLKLNVKGTLLKLSVPYHLVNGMIKFDTCLFSFDNAWDGYTKTATFYSNSTNKIEVLLENNSCVIPWENLINPGVLYIGVYGVKGDSVIPTNHVNMIIVNGAYAGHSVPSEATLDVNTQVINKIGEFSQAETLREQAETVRNEKANEFTQNENNRITNEIERGVVFGGIVTEFEELKADNVTHIEGIDTDYHALKTIMLDENNAANLQNQVDGVNSQLEQTASKQALDVVDAKVVNIIANATTTEGNTELIDGRVAYNGEIYPTIGENIRGENGKINEKLVRAGNIIYHNENNENMWRNGIIDGSLVEVVKAMFLIIKDFLPSNTLKATCDYGYKMCVVIYSDTNTPTERIYWVNEYYFDSNKLYRVFFGKEDESVITTAEYRHIKLLSNNIDYQVRKDLSAITIATREQYPDLWKNGIIDKTLNYQENNAFVITKDFLPSNTLKITCDDGYKMCVVIYSDTNTPTERIYWVNEYEFSKGILYKVYFGRVDEQVISAEIAYTHVNITVDAIEEKARNSNISNSILYGKVFVALGDSLFHGNTSGNEITWCNKLAQKYNMTIYNHGVNGNPIAYSANNDSGADEMSKRYETLESADYVVVLGGANDRRLNVPIGNNGDTNNKTFKGALNVLLTGMRTKYPKAKILFMTNYHRISGVNQVGAYELDYVDAMIEMCGLYSIPCFDNWRSSGLSWHTLEMRRWIDEGYVENGTTNHHFTDEAYDWLLPKYEKLMESL